MEAIKDLITCPVCLEIYADPHVLPCLHTLCAGCIQVRHHISCLNELRIFTEGDFSEIDNIAPSRTTHNIADVFFDLNRILKCTVLVIYCAVKLYMYARIIMWSFDFALCPI